MTDARIEAFLADVLAVEGENPDAIRHGVHVALADSEQIFKAAEANRRMKDKAAHACHARIVYEMQRQRPARRCVGPLSPAAPSSPSDAHAETFGQLCSKVRALAAACPVETEKRGRPRGCGVPDLSHYKRQYRFRPDDDFELRRRGRPHFLAAIPRSL
jgi:hypothetical protein